MSMTSHLNTVLPGATCSLLRSFRSSSRSRVSGGHVHAHLVNGRCQIIVAIRRLLHFVQIQAHASEHATTHQVLIRSPALVCTICTQGRAGHVEPQQRPLNHRTCQWPAGGYTNRFTRIFPLGSLPIPWRLSSSMSTAHLPVHTGHGHAAVNDAPNRNLGTWPLLRALTA